MGWEERGGMEGRERGRWKSKAMGESPGVQGTALLYQRTAVGALTGGFCGRWIVRDGRGGER